MIDLVHYEIFHALIGKGGLHFSSPEPLAHGELLGSLDVLRASSVLRRQQLHQRISPPKLLSGL